MHGGSDNCMAEQNGTNVTKSALVALAFGLWLALIDQGAAQDSANAASSVRWSTPSDATIRNILVDRVDRQRLSIGIVVGIIDPAGRRIVSYGQLNQGDTRSLSGDTLFEIGSIT